MFVGVVALRYQHHTCVVLITESFRVPRRPRWWGKGGTIRVNRSLKVYGILSNARSRAVLIKKLCKKLLVLRTIELKVLECLVLKSWSALIWSRVPQLPQT